jgi:hypothetical protein
MPHTKLSQLKWENESWLRVINFLEQENVFLKNRLALAIKGIESEHMADIEQFQTMFLNHDTLFSILAQDIANHKKALANAQKEITKLSQASLQQKKLRRDIDKLEKEFCSLRNKFNSYMANIVPA